MIIFYYFGKYSKKIVLFTCVKLSQFVWISLDLRSLISLDWIGDPIPPPTLHFIFFCISFMFVLLFCLEAHHLEEVSLARLRYRIHCIHMGSTPQVNRSLPHLEVRSRHMPRSHF